ncbi:hypothetical protein TVAG_346510 [Trichomonas vaginalis G3]|uniref:Uncharacterized protein n=1 Tax=Trichomonas vaginalis (strain ATCC PRA-98 / G3) TaxID=412133 RepID=A2G2A0_TRIV3|nr:hypothetical protein TVAGG3_0126200 [Trichomonas vaginalis G3]EAX88723.1 hypothetical protein TVAG_346510 [Trichomonas vaginalis G3]KAI5545790.1 hypothetical protein TVAGG3_0126200 [Trichomonas vaginalis G3]|eukprot:XP_001301653.1 hypothetical protein [Trichomonas vaginalis G3]
MAPTELEQVLATLEDEGEDYEYNALAETDESSESDTESLMDSLTDSSDEEDENNNDPDYQADDERTPPAHSTDTDEGTGVYHQRRTGNTTFFYENIKHKQSRDAIQQFHDELLELPTLREQDVFFINKFKELKLPITWEETVKVFNTNKGALHNHYTRGIEIKECHRPSSLTELQKEEVFEWILQRFNERKPVSYDDIAVFVQKKL